MPQQYRGFRIIDFLCVWKSQTSESVIFFWFWSLWAQKYWCPYVFTIFVSWWGVPCPFGGRGCTLWGRGGWGPRAADHIYCFFCFFFICADRVGPGWGDKRETGICVYEKGPIACSGRPRSYIMGSWVQSGHNTDWSPHITHTSICTADLLSWTKPLQTVCLCNSIGIQYNWLNTMQFYEFQGGP